MNFDYWAVEVEHYQETVTRTGFLKSTEKVYYPVLTNMLTLSVLSDGKCWKYYRQTRSQYPEIETWKLSCNLYVHV